MTLQVLVATMNQTDHSLLEKMNIQSDAIIGNQCDRNEIEEFDYNGHTIKYLSFNERGVGLNRNNTIMRSTADISVIGDDDLVYVDNYSEIIIEQFKENPKADVIIFNLKEEKPTRYIIKEKHRIKYKNYMKYGAVRIAVKMKSITKNGIFFNLHFGGGTEHSAGEDTLFLTECLRKKLNIIAIPIDIAYLREERESTWFKGYTDKFFKDKGVLFYHISQRWAKLLCFQFAIRRKNMFKEERTAMEAYRLMLKGIKEEVSI